MPIARSNYPPAIHALLASGLAGVGLTFAPPPLVLAVWLLLLGVVALYAGAQPAGALSIQALDEMLYARWIKACGEPSEAVLLRCHYLGPWLLGLDVGGARLWLWPDSVSASDHRALRRLLHRPGH
ncbi:MULTISPECIES: hypothetical protein [unclassified Halomonas]|uniref:hypothetical protein n=1 Tax=unclassified Halomonas TaxID=2609666 RepID=UPI002076A8E0|nr:hypothetical protein [Halomonas sp. S3-1-8]